MGRKTRRKDAGEGGGSAFTVLFTALMMILLSFFILLNSLATIDAKKKREALGSLRGTFGVLPGGMSAGKGRKMMVDQLSGMSGKDSLESFTEFLEEKGLMRDVGISVNKKGIMITFADKLLFTSGSSDISPHAQLLLNKTAEIISGLPNSIQIEGHTDNVPISTEKFPSNWELSTSRAVNILRYFAYKAKISQKRLFAVGFGEYRPIFPNDSEKERAKNRRVNIFILNNQEG